VPHETDFWEFLLVSRRKRTRRKRRKKEESKECLFLFCVNLPILIRNIVQLYCAANSALLGGAWRCQLSGRHHCFHRGVCHGCVFADAGESWTGCCKQLRCHSDAELASPVVSCSVLSHSCKLSVSSSLLFPLKPKPNQTDFV
jgi:hypothetical protein